MVPLTIDPLTVDQWYITGMIGAQETVHLNIRNTSYSGDGVLVSVVDNGVDMGHEDLVKQIAQGGYSYLPQEYDFSEADHGTAVAGIIAAQAGNGLGIRGVAPGAKIVPFNALRAPAISNLADALVREKERVWVSSNSWGDFNSWGEPMGLRSILKAALEDGTRYGRNGKGIVYIFSAGNGNAEKNSLPTDNVNYSGLVNNRYTVPVCAVDEHGVKASYSEVGATLVVCAPSKGAALGISTTDAKGDYGYNPKVFPNGDYQNSAYTRNFSGTSASAPMVAGVAALVLEANPNLGWRDVRAVLAKSASKNDASHVDWVRNGAGLFVNHSYGFGVVDAVAAIELAKQWQNYPVEKVLEVSKEVNQHIPDNDSSGIQSTITTGEDMTIEFVEVYVDASAHERLGDLEITLRSPAGSISRLAEYHHEAFAGYFRYKNWRFGSMRHLEESGKGDWILEVKDRQGGKSANLLSWTLKLYGH